jgi:hypothetical protein
MKIKQKKRMRECRLEIGMGMKIENLYFDFTECLFFSLLVCLFASFLFVSLFV